MYEIYPLGVDNKNISYEFGDFIVYSISPSKLPEIIQNLKSAHKKLREMSIDEIISVLDQVGDLWAHEYKKEYLKSAHLINNKSRELNSKEIELSVGFLNKEFLTALVDEELGDRHILDDWIEKRFVYLKRQPLGLLFHNLAGNAMITSTSSFTFGLLSKNVNLIKTPTEDPLSAYLFGKSLIDVDETFSKFFAVVYWPGSNLHYYKTLFSTGVDGVIHWGGKESLESIKTLAPYGTKVVEHGPKLSFVVVENLSADIGYKIAMDTTTWEQRACLSPRIVFAKKDIAKKLAYEISEGFRKITEDLPEERSMERGVEVFNKRQNYLLKDCELFYDKNSLWTVVYNENEIIKEDIDACMNRFIIVKPYETLNEVIDFFNKKELRPYIQTIGYNGDDKHFIDEVTYLGATHVTNIGEMNVHMPGFSHDGLYNLVELTKVVSHQKKGGNL